MRARRMVAATLQLFVMLALVLSACGPGQSTINPDSYQYKGKLMIGYAGPLTGSQAAVGIDLWHGAELAALHYNRQGGVLGYKVVIVPLDDQADGEVAVEVAQQFVEQRVKAVVGHYSSGATMPASSIYAAAGILEVTTMASNPAISQQGLTTFFRVCPVDSVQGPFDAEFAVNQLGAQRIAIVYIGWHLFDVGVDLAAELDGGEVSAELRQQFREHGEVLASSVQVKVDRAGSDWTLYSADTWYAIRRENQALKVYNVDTYSGGLRDEFSRRAEELGAQVVAIYPYEDPPVDFTDTVNKLQGDQPDLVFFSGYYPGGDLLLRQMREAGLTATFLSGDGSFEYGFLRDAGKAADGAYISSLFPDVLATPAMADWVKEFRTLYRYQPGINSPAGYAAVQVIAEGMIKANSFDADKVAEAIRSMTIETPYGPLRYDAKGDLVEQIIPMFLAQQGKFVEWTGE